MTISLAAFGLVILLSLLGAPLAVATFAVGFVGFAILRSPDAALAVMGQQTVEMATNLGLSVIPVFILMGEFIHRANISDDLYAAGNAWLGRRRGGLAMATIIACGGFSAVCGSSLATAATMSKVAMPHMRKYRYHDSLSAGSLAAGGTLGIMIPPSVPMALYGIVAEEDIGKLFIAGVVPGLLLVGLYLVSIAAVTAWRPSYGPRGAGVPAAERWRAYLRVWPVLLLFLVVLGGIYLGVFTPTEAAAVGAFGAYVFARLRGRLRSFMELIDALAAAARTSAMIFIIVFAAQMLSQLVNLSGMPYDLVDWVESQEVGQVGLVLLICLIGIIMGMIFESLGIILLLVPVFLPSLYAADVNLIWFGIVIIVIVEMGLITPPIGMNVFTVKSVIRDLSLPRIFTGVLPFLAANLVALGLLALFPQLALWLPDLMR